MRFQRIHLVAVSIAAGMLLPSTTQAQICGDGVWGVEELCVAPPMTAVKTTAPVRTVLASDINADGRHDIVAITSNRLYVRFGTATGLGATWWWQYAAVDLRDVATGDFDADGDLDIAIADAANDRLIVRWNLGANFGGNMLVPVGDQPIRILSARLNGDARTDLVVLNKADQTVTVLLSAGGAFAAAVYGVGDTPDIALGDCNNDARPDLVYVNNFGTATHLRARPNNWGVLGGAVVSILPLFDPVHGPLTPLSIAAGDLNGDGLADVSVSTSWSRLAPATGAGGCLFTPQPYGLTWAWAYRQRMVDFDQNGSLDVAAPHGVAPRYSVAWGNNAGSFNPYSVVVLAAGAAPVQDLAFGDFNGDGVRDVLIAASTSVLLQRGTP